MTCFFSRAWNVASLMLFLSWFTAVSYYFCCHWFLSIFVEFTCFSLMKAIRLVDEIFFFFNLYFGCVVFVFVSVRGLSLVAVSGGQSSSQCAGLSLSRPLLFRSTGSRCAGSVVVAHGPSSSTACGILPDQGSNPSPLHWQADSQPLRHQGSPSRWNLLMLEVHG